MHYDDYIYGRVPVYLKTNPRDPVTGQRDSNFGQRDPVIGSRDSDFGLRDSVNGSRDSNFGQRDSNFGQRDPVIGSRDSDFGQRDSVVGNRDANFGQREFVTGQRDSDFGQRDANFGQRVVDFGSRDPVIGQRDSDFGQRDANFGQRDLVFGQRDPVTGNRDANFGQRDPVTDHRVPVAQKTDPRDQVIDSRNSHHYDDLVTTSRNEVYGTNHGDILWSTENIDHLVGGGGDDYLVANIGNGSNDVLDGGNGRDTAVYVIDNFDDIKNFRCVAQNNQTEKVLIHNLGGHNQSASTDTLYDVESVAFTTDGHEFQQYDLDSLLTMMY